MLDHEGWGSFYKQRWVETEMFVCSDWMIEECLYSFRTVVKTLGRAGLDVMTKGVRFDLFCGRAFRVFLTWDGAHPVNFLFKGFSSTAPTKLPLNLPPSGEVSFLIHNDNS